MLKMVGGTGIVGEDMVCPFGLLNIMPGYETVEISGYPPLILENCLEKPLQGLNIYGHTTQAGIPSTESLQEIVSAGKKSKNFFDVSQVPTTYKEENGYGIVNNNDGSITVTTPSNNAAMNSTIKLRELCPELEVGKTYVLNATPTGTGSTIYLGKSASVWRFNQTRTITQDDLDSRVYFYASGPSTTATISEIMVNEGETALPYEPYGYFVDVSLTNEDGTQSQKRTLFSKDGFNGIPVSSGGNYTDESGQQWVADEIDLKNGVRRSRMWRTTLDGNITWSLYDIGKGFAAYNRLPITMNRRDGFCNQFVAITSVVLNQKGIWIGGSNNTSIYCLNVDFYDAALDDKGLANWKAHLNENPLEIMTYLDEPVETPLRPEEIESYKSLITYQGTTVISNDANAWMRVAYEKAMQQL